MLLEQFRFHFDAHITLAGSPYSTLDKCVGLCDAETLKQCLALGLWEEHMTNPEKKTTLQFSTYAHIRCDPDDFEDTWNVLVEHSLLQFDGLTKKEKFNYILDTQGHWSLSIMVRFKTLLKRDAKRIPGADRMFKVVKAIDSVK